MKYIRLLLGIAVLGVTISGQSSEVVAQSLSDAPDTPFKLATYKADGVERVGMVLGEQILDIVGASKYLVAEFQVSSLHIPDEMRSLIEEYATVKGRLYQIANHFSNNGTDGRAFAHDVGSVSFISSTRSVYYFLTVPRGQPGILPFVSRLIVVY